MSLVPPRSAIEAFGGTGAPELLAGGEGRSWRAGAIVLKPVDRPTDELEWEADLLAGLESDAFRIPCPQRSAGGALVVDGWYARNYLVGEHERGRWQEIIQAADAFHAAIAHRPRPQILDRRMDRWAIGDRVAWGELPVRDFYGVDHVARLASARRPLDAPSQLIHGDLTGNSLFAEGLPPALIDISPYWRPAPFAAAIVVADALVWEGADALLLEGVSHIDRFGQYLVRALIYRVVSGALEPGRPEFAGDRDPYGAAVELALAISS